MSGPSLLYALLCSYFILFSTISVTTEGSASVLVSPSSSRAPDATFLRILLMILPDLVFGRPGTN